jgi:hypothetical protein
MDKDYQNFVDRMGSFEDTINISDGKVEIDNNIVTRNRGSLAHVGIPGMKWGHHKAINANTIGAAARTGQSAASLGQTVNKNGYSSKSLKEARSLSDDDLKKLTSRLNLENNYMNAKNQQSGRSKVEGILSTAGATMAVVSSAALMVDAIRKAKG